MISRRLDFVGRDSNIDADVRCKRESAFQRRLFKVKEQLESGIELKEGAMRWASRYMSVSTQGAVACQRGRSRTRPCGRPGSTSATSRSRQTRRWTGSTVDIFDWFDCIETTEVKTEAGKFRWSTESINRDRLFLERLGVVKPVVHAAAAVGTVTGDAQ